jgi:hypothetical protein
VGLGGWKVKLGKYIKESATFSETSVNILPDEESAHLRSGISLYSPWRKPQNLQDFSYELKRMRTKGIMTYFKLVFQN